MKARGILLLIILYLSFSTNLFNSSNSDIDDLNQINSNISYNALTIPTNNSLYFPKNEITPTIDTHHLVSPVSLIINQSNLIISEYDNNQISTYTQDGSYLSSISVTSVGGEIETNGTHFFVADTSSIKVYNLTGSLVQQIEIPSQTLAFAINIELNQTHIVTSSAFLKEINVFYINGTYIGNFGPYDGTNGYPLQIQLNSTELLVSEFTGTEDVVKRYDLAGNLLETINFETVGIEIYASHIDQNHIYIYDDNIIRKFDPNGLLIGTVGIKGGSINEFASINDMDGNSTHLFLTDERSHKIIIINKSTNTSTSFGSSEGVIFEQRGIVSNGTHVFVVDNTKYKVHVYDSDLNYINSIGYYGTSPGTFASPYGITSNSTHILVTDTYKDTVDVFTHSGTFVSSFGQSGSLDGEFLKPTSIAIDDTSIYVVDENRHDIQIFDLFGNYVNKITNTNVDGSDNPNSVASNNTHIFISEAAKDEIVIFDRATLQYQGSLIIPDGTISSGDMTIAGDSIYVADRNEILTYNFKEEITSSFKLNNNIFSYSWIAHNGTLLYYTDSSNSTISSYFPYYDKPSNITLTSEIDSIILNWTNPVIPNSIFDNFITFQVRRSDPNPIISSFVTTFQISNTTMNSFIDNPGSNGDYYYEVDIIFNIGSISSEQKGINFSFSVSNSNSNQDTSSNSSQTTSDTSTGTISPSQSTSTPPSSSSNGNNSQSSSSSQSNPTNPPNSSLNDTQIVVFVLLSITTVTLFSFLIYRQRKMKNKYNFTP